MSVKDDSLMRGALHRAFANFSECDDLIVSTVLPNMITGSTWGFVSKVLDAKLERELISSPLAYSFKIPSGKGSAPVYYIEVGLDYLSSVVKAINNALPPTSRLQGDKMPLFDASLQVNDHMDFVDYLVRIGKTAGKMPQTVAICSLNADNRIVQTDEDGLQIEYPAYRVGIISFRLLLRSMGFVIVPNTPLVFSTTGHGILVKIQSTQPAGFYTSGTYKAAVRNAVRAICSSDIAYTVNYQMKAREQKIAEATKKV